MALAGKTAERLAKALLEAFTKSKLTDMMYYDFEQRLENIALGEDYTEIVRKVVQWADSRGRIGDLVACACKRRPDNAELEAIAKLLAEPLEVMRAGPDDRTERGGAGFVQGKGALLASSAAVALGLVLVFLVLGRSRPVPPVTWLQEGNVRGLPAEKGATVFVGNCQSVQRERGHFEIQSTEECRREPASKILVEGFEGFVGPPLPASSNQPFEIAWKGVARRGFFEGWVKCGAAGVDALVHARSCPTQKETPTDGTGYFSFEVPPECQPVDKLDIQLLPRGKGSVTIDAAPKQTVDLSGLLPAACGGEPPPTTTSPVNKGAGPARCAPRFTRSMRLATRWIATCPCPVSWGSEPVVYDVAADQSGEAQGRIAIKGKECR